MQSELGDEIDHYSNLFKSHEEIEQEIEQELEQELITEEVIIEPEADTEEVTEEVLEGSQSMVWEEAGNRLHSQKALLEFLLA